MRHLVVLILVSLLLTGSLQAQVIDPNNIPATNTVMPNFGSSIDVTQKVEGILKEQEQTVMSGLEEYALDMGQLMVDYAIDEMVEALANAVLAAPLATKIMKAYQKIKDNDLSNEIEKLTQESKYSLNKQLKAKYQNYKVKFARMESKFKTLPDIKNSVTAKLATKTKTNLWPAHVDMLNEYYDGTLKQAIMEYRYPELGNVPGNKTNNSYLAFAADALLMEDAESYYKALQLVSDQNFDLEKQTDGPLVAYSQYDRLMMKRKLMEEMNKRINGIKTVRSKVSGYVQGQLQKKDKHSLVESMGAKTPYITH